MEKHSKTIMVALLMPFSTLPPPMFVSLAALAANTAPKLELAIFKHKQQGKTGIRLEVLLDAYPGALSEF